MYRPGSADPFQNMLQQHMMGRGGRPRRFDEYYRCYPVVMLPGPERDDVNHGGKVFMPPSALDKLTTLHITYPMLFELINGAKGIKSHSGVLEFIAEEGRCYLPHWLMETLALEPGDLLQIKSTDLPAGNFIKLQPQSSAFLDISDPKAVLERTFRNFSCLTLGDMFTFKYNDTIYSVAVLEVKPDGADTHAISVQETDLEVDFAEPVGYNEELERQKAANASRSSASGTKGGAVRNPHPHGGLMHSTGTMAQAINYASIAPDSTDAATGHANAASSFTGGGHRLVPRKVKAGAQKSTGTPTPTGDVVSMTKSTDRSIPISNDAVTTKKTSKSRSRPTNGPQPLRLPPGKLFFGYAVKPLKSKDVKEDGEQSGDGPGASHHFRGQGETLRKKK